MKLETKETLRNGWMKKGEEEREIEDCETDRHLHKNRKTRKKVRGETL